MDEQRFGTLHCDAPDRRLAHLLRVATIHLPPDLEIYEDLSDSRSPITTLGRALGKLWLNLRELYLPYFVSLVLFCVILATLTKEKAYIDAAIGAAAFAAVTTLVSHLMDISQRKNSVINILIGEMNSIVRALILSNTVGNIIGTYILLEEKVLPSGVRRSESEKKESYFSNFEASTPYLGGLSPKAVENVTAFYTFLKTSRDATGSMELWCESWYNDVAKINDLIRITYSLFLMAVNGRKAAETIIDAGERRSRAIVQFETIELQTFLFLYCVVPLEDPRRRRLEFQAKSYLEKGRAYWEKFAEEQPPAACFTQCYVH